MYPSIIWEILDVGYFTNTDEGYQDSTSYLQVQQTWDSEKVVSHEWPG